ncbi:hypothetical protein TSOC_005286 [Tetrabaena socialis]|uniref:Uncharacterized protein n=1 Tax=Tetrabaena socialis TaxID=47790 RepID=A0A2J8A6T0_9CHLO|nr:hypothetical protein TSOC_005286 [Tetrabaena socialis]|eukprot:PNH08193.1 hypothetical protein TSOC_005286 [Tetrabaena socialis]
MAASEGLMEPEALLDRWERLLRRTPGEPSLWRDYLDRRRAAFSAVKLHRLQAAYSDALHAMASERARLQRQAASASSEERAQLLPRVPLLDRELCRVALELLELELGAGAAEVAVARVQALVEFHCPSSAAAAAAAAGVWWAQLAAEAGPPGGGGDRAGSSDPRVLCLLERAAASRHTARCGGVWLWYMSYEGRTTGPAAGALSYNAAARLPYAKRVFLRGVREVPLCKELWLAGFALLGCGGPCVGAGAATAAAAPGVAAGSGGGSAADTAAPAGTADQPAGKAGALVGGVAASASVASAVSAASAGLLSSREVSELLVIAGDKGVRLRTDVYEVMLEHLGEAQG